MNERDRLLPDPDKYTPMTHEGDYDAPHGGLTVQQQEYLKRRGSRTLWAAGGAGLTIVLGVTTLVGYEITHQDGPKEEQAAAAPVSPGTAASLSPTPSKSASATASKSASASPSKTSASPTPSKISPSALPSESPSATFSVSFPPETPSSPPPTTETTAPAACTWETSGGDVTVGECGDHTAYNDENRTGAHQLPVGMMFGNVCMKGSMVAIHYGGSYDLVDDNGYFPVPGPC